MRKTGGWRHSSSNIIRAWREAEISRIAHEAIERWSLGGLTVIHRVGKILPGENIVLVIAASRHRHAAFKAAGFVMDFLKSRAPFWKQEHSGGRHHRRLGGSPPRDSDGKGGAGLSDWAVTEELTVSTVLPHR